MLHSQYLGSTYIAGASYLNTSAILNIKEGFNDGVSSHLVNVGNYIVDDMENNGFDNSTVRLNASSMYESLKKNTLPFNRSYKGQLSYYNDFLTADSIFDVTSQVGTSIGTTNSAILVSANDASGQYIVFNNIQVRDVSFTIKAKCDRWGDFTYLQQSIRAHNGESADGVNIHFYVNKNNWYIRHRNFDSSFLTLASGSLPISLVNDTYYWFNLTARGSNFKVAFSTSETGIWSYLGGVQGVTRAIIDRTIEAGEIGILCNVGDGILANYQIDSVVINEIAPVQTNDSIMKSMAVGSGLEYDSLNTITGFSPYWIGTTSTWNIGTSGTASYSDNAAGNSWTFYLTTGDTFTDFVATCDTSNTGSVHSAMMYGTTNHFTIFRVRGLGATLIIGWEEGVSTSPTSYQTPSEYMINKDVPFQIGMVKTGRLFTGLINGVAVSSHYGLSTYNSGNNLDYTENLVTPSGSIGVGKYLGISGSATYSNFKVSAFSTLQKDIQFEQGTDVQSAIEQMLGDGDIIISKPNGIYVTKFGVSQGLHYTGVSSGYQNNSRLINNNAASTKSMIIKNNSIYSSRALNTVNSPVTQFQADSSKTEYIYGKDESTIANALNALESSSINAMSNIDTQNIQITGRPTIELNDQLNVVNDALGVSFNGVVSNFSKNIDFASSDFTQDITLKRFRS